MKKLFLIFAVCLSMLSLSLPGLSQQRITQEHKDRAAQIVSQMTLEEKISYIAGYRSWHIRGIERLGLPMVRMQDGPQGIRDKYSEVKKSTLYPSGIAAAATWDRALINQMGVALGRDARARGIHVLLGPGANIYRSPLCGRNFEYYGEDPYLAGEMAASYITGVQSQEVIACIKHFAGNNQEYARHSVSSDIDERTMHEIYFPAFEKAVKKAGVGAVMTSYNLVNGVHSSESKYLNYDVLRDMWGYDGLVMSDWRSCYSPLNVATYGVDLEMPKAECMTPESIRYLIDNDMLEEKYIDRKCQHIIQTILAFGFDRRSQKDENIPLNDPKSDSVSLELSRSAVVMLKNEDGFLPFDKGDVFVCGHNADKIVTGGGSGFVDAIVSTTVARGMASMGKGIRTKVFSNSPVRTLEGMFADDELTTEGINVQIYSNPDLAGKPALEYVAQDIRLSYDAFRKSTGLNPENMSSRHVFYFVPKEDAVYTICLNSNDGSRLSINGRTFFDRWERYGGQNARVKYAFEAGKKYKLIIEQNNKASSMMLDVTFEPEMLSNPKALNSLEKADYVVACLGFDSLTEQEDHDRTFELPNSQADFLKKLLEYNSNVVVVLNGGGGIEMASWLDDVKAVLMAWYPGQQGGLAVSEILTGKVCPSGKLPISIEAALEDNPTSDSYKPNVPRIRNATQNPYSRVEYREGIFSGYRGYDKSGVKPLFPFGYGLSYTSFEYSDLKIKEDAGEYAVSFTVKNVGKVAGAEVAQVYVTDEESSRIRPQKELKGFEKVFLKPGESRTVTVGLTEEAFRFYDPGVHGWVVEPGRFIIHVGASSSDIRLNDVLNYQNN